MEKLINRQTKDMVAESIRNEILSGGIAAGEELKQELLAKMLGVSRMPVREALQLLEQEGYIERLPNRHMVVVDLGAEKVSGMIGVIAAMETEIILQGCSVQAGDRQEEPERQLSAMKRAIDREEPDLAASYELEYHLSLARLLGITYIEQLFNKAMGGYVSNMIRHQPGELSERYRRLEEIDKKRRNRTISGIESEIREYYRTLFDSWNRKER